ncbi:uncharacterized protein STEHIDRAFT_157859 [Stereum hirsutum FP-91666 SS1]|uniref:uncharacterized protein n=1 Tax=Stereum hirsutum (strain FP-91666) TaxID=721885 RepID=UPI0004449309|nr:uncharacterized protein STEHIDRAFT_157859 [Stereum hirsutum FP-91666 SS1]EIM85209.1 hypothetical protein STEHIDRAFT_157859 [Stereum hirsutum FP-91666 SS1]
MRLYDVHAASHPPAILLDILLNLRPRLRFPPFSPANLSPTSPACSPPPSHPKCASTPRLGHASEVAGAARRYICEVVGLVSSVEGLECEEFSFGRAFVGDGGGGGGGNPVVPPTQPNGSSSSMLSQRNLTCGANL